MGFLFSLLRSSPLDFLTCDAFHVCVFPHHWLARSCWVFQKCGSLRLDSFQMHRLTRGLQCFVYCGSLSTKGSSRDPVHLSRMVFRPAWFTAHSIGLLSVWFTALVLLFADPGSLGQIGFRAVWFTPSHCASRHRVRYPISAFDDNGSFCIDGFPGQ